MKEEREGKLRMVTFTKHETLPARDLRTISQKSLLDLVNKNDKVGLILNDEISIAMVKVEKLEEILLRLYRLEELFERLEDADYEKSLEGRLAIPEEDWVPVSADVSFRQWLDEGDSE